MSCQLIDHVRPASQMQISEHNPCCYESCSANKSRISFLLPCKEEVLSCGWSATAFHSLPDWSLSTPAAVLWPSGFHSHELAESRMKSCHSLRCQAPCVAIVSHWVSMRWRFQDGVVQTLHKVQSQRGRGTLYRQLLPISIPITTFMQAWLDLYKVWQHKGVKPPATREGGRIRF
jgi:hypothetical protein